MQTTYHITSSPDNSGNQSTIVAQYKSLRAATRAAAKHHSDTGHKGGNRAYWAVRDANGHRLAVGV
jgi:hypothetical protein